MTSTAGRNAQGDAESSLPRVSQSNMLADGVSIGHLKDPELLTVLAAEAVAEGHRMVGRLIDEWHAGENRFGKPGECAYVAMWDGRVRAVCGLNADPFAQDGRVGRVRRLYVSSALRRRGIGATLVRQIIRDATGQFRELRLRTHDPRAAAFYEAMGFSRVEGIEHCTHRMSLSA